MATIFECLTVSCTSALPSAGFSIVSSSLSPRRSSVKLPQFRSLKLTPASLTSSVVSSAKKFNVRGLSIGWEAQNTTVTGLSFLRHSPLNFISELPASRVLLVQAKPPTSDKSSEQKWVHEGVITESLPNGMFHVKLDNQDSIIGYISGKIRKNFVRILPGDKVRVEVSRYDTSKGRIVYRLRSSS